MTTTTTNTVRSRAAGHTDLCAEHRTRGKTRGSRGRRRTRTRAHCHTATGWLPPFRRFRHRYGRSQQRWWMCGRLSSCAPAKDDVANVPMMVAQSKRHTRVTDVADPVHAKRKPLPLRQAAGFIDARLPVRNRMLCVRACPLKNAGPVPPSQVVRMPQIHKNTTTDGPALSQRLAGRLGYLTRGRVILETTCGWGTGTPGPPVLVQ